MRRPRVNLWARDRLYVNAYLNTAGDLIIDGQDLSGSVRTGEYEYSLTVPAADVPRVVAALAGEPGDDVLALLVTNATTIVQTGERTWLRSLGIDPGFWAHTEI